MENVDIRPGVSIAYKDEWFGPQWEEKETIILIHGIAESSVSWAQWVPILAKRYRVIRIDLPCSRTRRAHNTFQP